MILKKILKVYKLHQYQKQMLNKDPVELVELNLVNVIDCIQKIVMKKNCNNIVYQKCKDLN